MVTLRRAIRENRLDDFIAQEEARGVGPINEAELNDAIKVTIKPQQSEDQTSRSHGRGGSSGT